jgi:hypothetical protein
MTTLVVMRQRGADAKLRSHIAERLRYEPAQCHRAETRCAHTLQRDGRVLLVVGLDGSSTCPSVVMFTPDKRRCRRGRVGIENNGPAERLAGHADRHRHATTSWQHLSSMGSCRRASRLRSATTRLAGPSGNGSPPINSIDVARCHTGLLRSCPAALQPASEPLRDHVTMHARMVLAR